MEGRMTTDAMQMMMTAARAVFDIFEAIHEYPL